MHVSSLQNILFVHLIINFQIKSIIQNKILKILQNLDLSLENIINNEIKSQMKFIMSIDIINL